MSKPHEPDERPPIEVLARLLADQRSGRLGPLEEYERLFPGQERAVSAEYRRLADAGAQATGAAPDSAAGVGGPAESQRVGPYELLRELGRGGQGRVWLARDTRLQREVALKVVACSPLLGEVSRRFKREARTASRLDHPGLCPVYDVGTDETLAWIAMRYVPGETLAQRIERRDGPSTEPEADARLIEQLAQALQAAHASGVIHRDVKPANVIVTPEGVPVLLDFGIAREEEEALPLTLTGDSLGTPFYMSPEQLDGRPVDHRTDVWSLGATAFELLTGQRPFDGATRDGLIEAVLRREPEPLSRLNPRVPRDLQVIVATALTKDANRRYQTAADLAEDLERLRTGRSIRARPAGPLERVRRWAARNPGVAASLAATFVILVGALVVSTRLLSRTREALDANATLLDEVTQLADAKVAADLLAEAPRLWPAIPSRAPAMDGWLKRARSLEGRVEAHRRALEDVDRRMGSLVAEEFADTADTETHAWMKEQLTEIIASVELLLEEVPRMQARYALAEGLARRSLDEPGAQWAAAAARVAADPRFEGFELTPQLGLLPLGPDPDSALEEFAHLQSGQPPQRDVASGRLALAAESSIVLVLVPGGEAGVGCDPPGEGLWEGDPFVDPRARELDGPRHPIRLDPYFISKYELTHGQWVRQTGSGRALYAILPGVAELQPTEQVSFVSCAEVLGQLSLRIPSEAQWEHAARGGTSTVYYTGDEPESLIGHTNLADEGSRNNGGAPRWEYVPWLEDGFHTTAPVGSFLANPYGLHDVVGNVYEWVDAPWLAIDAAPPRDGDGAATHERMKARVVRGGSFAKSDLHGRSGHRDGLPGHLFPPDIGVRPARAVR